MKREGLALYLRLSREDAVGESESIQNQRNFLCEYARQHAWTVTAEYVDDGYSGTNFERPAFLQMLHAIEAGEIQIVLTKDLSRLGRDYIEIGRLLEHYFPSQGVRYIAVNDGIDTAIRDSQANALSPFTSVMNDFYARDISKKVRTSLSIKRQRGEFIGSSAPYGYRKDPLNPHHLLVDEEAATVVRRIVQLYLSGHGLLGIANLLSAMQIPTPSQYKQLGTTQTRFPGLWNESILRRILTNPTYIGNLTQNRSTTISYKLRKRVRIPTEDWLIVEGTHEGILDVADFEAVQRLLHHKGRAVEQEEQSKHLLSGLLFCADCAAPMTFSKSGNIVYIRCRTAKRHASLGLCTNHCIREDVVEHAVRQTFRELAHSIDPVTLSTWAQTSPAEDIPDKQLRLVREKLAQNNQVLLSLYKDKVSGLLDTAEYLRMREQLQSERAHLQEQLDTRIHQASQRPSWQDRLTHLQDLLRFERVPRPVLLGLVDRILIHEDKGIEIFLTCKTPH